VLARTKRPPSRRPAPSSTGGVWRLPPPRRQPPVRTVKEQAEARVGEPLHVVCPLEMLAQDRPGERWQGNQRLWIALGEQTIWFLHDATLGRLGGVWDALPRQGLHIAAQEQARQHDVELSWPQHARLIIGTLDGPREHRTRLLGLLAADELGLREILTPSPPPH